MSFSRPFKTANRPKFDWNKTDQQLDVVVMVLDLGENDPTSFDMQKMKEWTFVGAAGMTWNLNSTPDEKTAWGNKMVLNQNDWYSAFVDQDDSIGLVDNSLMFALAMPVLGVSLLFGCCF